MPPDAVHPQGRLGTCLPRTRRGQHHHRRRARRACGSPAAVSRPERTALLRRAVRRGAGIQSVACWAAPTGPEVLPSAEIDFSAFPPGKPRIVGHRAKWEADSFEFHHTPRRFDFSPGDDEAAGPACSTWPGPAGGCSACGDTPASISASIGRAGRGSWRSTPIRACRPTPVSSPPRAASGISYDR